MEQKPVNETDFWKFRIEVEAKDDIRKSVYQTNDDNWKKFNEIHQEIIRATVTGSVLDAGCGYGRMAELFHPSDYVGIDFSPDFIALAKKNYPDHRFIRATIEQTPMIFAEGQFDWAVCVSIRRMIITNVSQDAWDGMLAALKQVAKQVLVLEYEDPDKYEIL